MKRILDISESKVRLSIRNECLVIASEQAETVVPLLDLLAVIISSAAVTYTHAVLAGLARSGVSYVACDSTFKPVAWLLPVAANSLQGERFRKQRDCSRAVTDALWRNIIEVKIEMQARVLESVQGHDAGLRAISARIDLGNIVECEAQAARGYWTELFGDRIRRKDDFYEENPLLNYGYTVLRSCVARSVCGAGLHPSFGLFHHNRYNAYALADDLMEPFRPLIDVEVCRLVHGTDQDVSLDPTTKHSLISVIFQRYRNDKGEARTLHNLIELSAQKLMVCLTAGRFENIAPLLQPAPIFED